MGGRAWVVYKPSKRELILGWMFGWMFRSREDDGVWKLPIHRTYK